MSGISIYFIGNIFAALFLFTLLLYLYNIKHVEIKVKDITACAILSFGSWMSVFAFLFCSVMLGIAYLFDKIEKMDFWNKRIF